LKTLNEYPADSVWIEGGYAQRQTLTRDNPNIRDPV
jgi:hypothetical protein